QMNQGVIALELQRLKSWLQHQEAAELDGQIAEAATAPSALDLLTDAFGLTPFERSLLLLCAGVEFDSQIAALCAQSSPKGVNFALALAVLDEPHWSALTPARPLRRWRMLELEQNAPLATAALRIDERILHFLAGINLLDARLEPLLTLHETPALMARGQAVLAQRFAHDWSVQHGQQAVVHLSGDDPAGAEDVAAAAAQARGFRLYILRAEHLPAAMPDLDAFAVLWDREAALLPAVLLVQCGDAPVPAAAQILTERLSGTVMVSAREPQGLARATHAYEISRPDAVEQHRLWRAVLGAAVEDGNAVDAALDSITTQFRFSARTIVGAGRTVSARVAGGEKAAAALWSICRGTGRSRLDDLASRIVPRATWDDLILPAPQLGTLRHIAAQLRQRRRVHYDWGFVGHNDRGLGVSVLFSGESGTGKTLAAEVLASELNLDLYRIDLSSVVSKYIGETEKNLRRVFDAAEDSGAILLFDEADALFGKRSEVKDSHDRYANIEISYLLQRMEAYRGLAILTTNLKSALDPAFQRRLRFIVPFPFPDASQREQLWRRAFPASAPAAELDFSKLARLNVAGGAVRNISLNAAFLAAEAGEAIGMGHLLRAAQADRAKVERGLSDVEVRGWA
ncbi:MAG TPA: ATP-binding protein, partial [Rhizomicrobium sp.]